jgi:hypothetical protein
MLSMPTPTEDDNDYVMMGDSGDDDVDMTTSTMLQSSATIFRDFPSNISSQQTASESLPSVMLLKRTVSTTLTSNYQQPQKCQMTDDDDDDPYHSEVVRIAARLQMRPQSQQYFSDITTSRQKLYIEESDYDDEEHRRSLNFLLDDQSFESSSSMPSLSLCSSSSSSFSTSTSAGISIHFTESGTNGAMPGSRRRTISIDDVPNKLFVPQL